MSQNFKNMINTFIILSIIFIFVIAIKVYFLMPSFLKSMEGKNWVKTPCIILSSEVTSEVHTTPKGQTYITYGVNMRYSYKFNGKTYKANDYNFSNTFYGSEAQEIINLYPKGKLTCCYVNPGFPMDAIIDRESPFTIMYKGLLLIIVIYIVISIPFMGIAYIRREKKILKNNGSPLK